MLKHPVLFCILCAFLILLLVLWILWGNSALTVTTHVIKNDAIPDDFSGFRIVQISDLHSTEFGKENSTLLSMIRDLEPDIIVITGDLLDRRRLGRDRCLTFAENAAAIVPTYYISGNHEATLDRDTQEYSQLRKQLLRTDVTVLEDEAVLLQRGASSISLIGLQDYHFAVNRLYTDEFGYSAEENPPESVIPEILNPLMEEAMPYTILLSHRPELFDIYASSGVDLVFSGHAHGGQFRLPGLGGLWAPGQGLFPKYTSGSHTQGDTTMIVSRGLGNSSFPFRLNNRPEIILVELQPA